MFDTTRVHRFDIAIAADVFKQGEADLKTIIDSATGDLDGIKNPMWMAATVTYDSQRWSQVGVRWKGHASLKGAYKNGIRKLSMKLKFDAFEDSFPQTLNQRFYGFKAFALSNGYQDPSLIRDKTAAELFRAVGVPAPREAFAEVYVDIGDGPFFMGVYTMVEDPADRMLEVQVGDGKGNLYKPWGDAARFLPIANATVEAVSMTVADVRTYFEKETNQGDSDWSDITAVINALHAERTDALTWRTQLEKLFDVQSFLKVLAVNQTMVNWDSYGCMHHNYLVYANPLNNNRFMWLPWDFNESMAMTATVGCVPPGSVMLDEIVSGTDKTVDTAWPLIKFILSDPQYRADYKTHLRNTLDKAFTAEPLVAKMRTDHALIAPYVARESGLVNTGPFSETGSYRTVTAANFEISLTSGTDALEPHVAARRAAVEAVLRAP